jgi:Flp pilus assembly protein TadD
VLLVLAAAACDARQAPRLTPTPSGEESANVSVRRPPADSLETFMAKVRQLAVAARPNRPAAATIEAQDPGLAAAVAAATFTPTPTTHRAAAHEYRRLGIADKAHQHLGAALALGPDDPATHDAIARLWRDTGFPHLALGDAYRALYFAPDSAVLHNTLGTILQALGQRQEARTRYERALQLDPTAAYALTNLCYGWVLDGRADKAIAACRHALQLEPGLVAAQNNLGLAYAVGGDLRAAREAFSASGDAARAFYNTGIVHLARREYGAALKAFRAAQSSRPGMRLAAARAEQVLQAQSAVLRSNE